MSRRLRLAWTSLAVLGALALATPSHANVVWGERRRAAACEPPYVFYSSRHVGGLPPWTFAHSSRSRISISGSL